MKPRNVAMPTRGVDSGRQAAWQGMIPLTLSRLIAISLRKAHVEKISESELSWIY